MHKKMCADFNTVSYDTAKLWFWKFKAGNINIEDEPRFDLLAKVDWDKLKQIISQDTDVSTRIIALDLEVCQKAIVNALKCINLTFNCWVLH